MHAVGTACRKREPGLLTWTCMGEHTCMAACASAPHAFSDTSDKPYGCSRTHTVRGLACTLYCTSVSFLRGQGTLEKGVRSGPDLRSGTQFYPIFAGLQLRRPFIGNSMPRKAVKRNLTSEHGRLSCSPAKLPLEVMRQMSRFWLGSSWGCSAALTISSTERREGSAERREAEAERTAAATQCLLLCMMK